MDPTISVLCRYFARNIKKTIFFTVLFGPILSFHVLNQLYPIRINIDYSQVVYANDSTVIHSFLNDDDKWRMKTELNEIVPDLKKAIINKEDKSFYQHYGVDIFAITRALYNNIVHGRTTSGASTITMQVARLLDPKERSYSNKFVEIFRAIQLEYNYSKDEILQMYLNMVPYGGNIEGVKSASVLYFDKLPNQLSPAEITTLAIIPNRPTSLKLGYANQYIKDERNRWLKRFESEGVFSTEQVNTAINEPLDAQRLESPKTAPQYCWKIKRENPENYNIYTYLNLNVQDKVSKIAYNYIQRQKQFGIFNTAIVVIDNRTNQIISYLGSPDIKDSEHFGQVDGVQAIRSPGSTLKPLAYAIAFDQGIITPKTIITDVATDFGDYEPKNFNEEFNGTISIEDALAYSLNVPAVKIIDQVGVKPFVNKLRNLGFEQIDKDRNKLGLSVVLGGCGVSLEELAGMYSCLANRGNFTPPSKTRYDSNHVSTPILSESAAYMITKILTKPERPDFPNNFQSSYHIPQVAWKTGTSYGRKDAWSIGYNNHYTVAVWVGNFSGDGVRELTGSTRATPLVFEIFNAIDHNSEANWYNMPKKSQLRYVCEESGLIPNTFCTNQIIDIYLPGISSNRKCQHMKTIFVSHDDKNSYCTSCLPTTGYKKVLFPNYPAELISYFKTHGIGYNTIPEHYPLCRRIFHEDAPVITSPANNREYIIDVNDAPEVMLSCHVHNEVKEVFWYINDKFYRKAKGLENIFFKPVVGRTKISCSDDKGRNSDIEITIHTE